MPPDLTRLTTISRQPSSADYDPNRHAVAVDRILDSPCQEASNDVNLFLHGSRSNVMQDETSCQGSFHIRFFDAVSGTVKEQVFTEDNEFDSEVMRILEFQGSQVQDISSSSNNSVMKTTAPDRDPLLCETVLRSTFAQGKSGFSLEDRLRHSEIIKRAFSLSESTYRVVEARAVKAVQYRRADVRTQLEEMHQDKSRTLYPQQFENFTLYEKRKAEEIEELTEVDTFLGRLRSYSGRLQISIYSTEDLSTNSVHCINPRSCYWRSDKCQVYCTVKVKPSGEKLNNSEDIFPDYKTHEVTYLERAQWDDESPWIPVNSAHDQLCLEVWSSKQPTRLSKGYKDMDSGPLLRHLSQRRKQISWGGDLLLGQFVMSMDKIESRALSSGSICGTIPMKSYPLSNTAGEKTRGTIRLQIAFACERLFNDPVPEKTLHNPPLNDLEAAYDAVMQLAFEMHLEGELQLEETWQSILSCFESHYRLRRERCCLAVVKYMAHLFQPDVDYLSNILREWRPVCKAAKEGRLSRPELSLHADVVTLLVRPTMNTIEEFQNLFSLNPAKGVFSKLIELLSLILCWDPNPKEVISCFKRWLKVSCDRRFKKHMSEQSIEGIITTNSFSTVISLLRKDLMALSTWSDVESPEGIDFFQTCAPEYYRLVSQNITGFGDAKNLKISATDFTELATEFSFFHHELMKKGVAVNLLDLHHVFRDHILNLIATMKPRMIDWIISSINDEKWEPISTQTDALFSFSVVDLYFMINGVVEEVTARLSCFPFGKLYYTKIENSICTAVGTYLQITEKLCLQELPDKLDEEEQDFSTRFKSTYDTKAVCISKALCVKLNNLYAVLQQQMSLESNLAAKWGTPVHPSLIQPETADPWSAYQIRDSERIAEMTQIEDPHHEGRIGQQFEKLHSLVEQSITNVIGSIAESMQNELTKRLQKVMETCSIDGRDSMQMENLEILTIYLDAHLKILNEWLDASVFKYLLLEIAGALLFCMEEFALNRDEDPNPMTAQQCHRLEEILKFFYDYFHGNGIGISKSQMDLASARLRKILVCSALHTRDLCTLYWRAWDRFNSDDSAHTSCDGSSFSESHVYDKEGSLHVLDFLLLLQQRDDDEARIIVANQKFSAKTKMMQFIFGLPKDEEMVASYTCRNSAKRLGTLYITAKHVGFGDVGNGVVDNQRQFILPFERIRQINLVGSDAISIVQDYHPPQRFSRFSSREAILQVIYDQVKNTGMFLEKYMAQVWGEVIGKSAENKVSYLKRFRCSRKRLISKHQGSLIISATCLVFEPDKKIKKIYMDHGAISRIHGERRGLRASGVVIDLKSGDSLEFVDFENTDLSAKDIAQEIEKFVLGGSCQGVL